MPTVQVLKRSRSRIRSPKSQFAYWPSKEAGFVVFIMPPDPDIIRFEALIRFRHPVFWCWYIDYLDETYSYGFRQTEQKAIESVLKVISILSGSDINYLRELMEYEVLMYSLASIGG